MLTIRRAGVNDMALLRTLIRELAEYERELESVAITEEQLRRDGFSERPAFSALVAEWGGQPAGYAVYFPHYSTWTGRQMFLEDLFVRPQFRGHKIGNRLMAEVASIARRENCVAMRWEVLDWNQKAIKVYHALGAEFLEGWKLMMLRGDALDRLADQS
jgi:GNAT superfamily N-acetyltransferase